MTNPPNDSVILGHLPAETHPPHTHPDRVAHPQPGFIAPTATAGGDAPPIHDTPSTPTPAQTVATRPSSQPTHPVTANNRDRQPTRLRLSPVATTVLSVVVAATVATAGILTVWFAASIVDTPPLVARLAVIAVGCCGALLVFASLLDQKAKQ